MVVIVVVMGMMMCGDVLVIVTVMMMCGDVVVIVTVMVISSRVEDDGYRHGDDVSCDGDGDVWWLSSRWW